MFDPWLAVVCNLGISQHLFALVNHSLLDSVCLHHLQAIAQMIVATLLGQSYKTFERVTEGERGKV